MKFLFIINPRAGNYRHDFKSLLNAYLINTKHSFDCFELTDRCSPETIRQKIAESGPDRVVAVGGDGTVKLAAESLVYSAVALGILPTGSANGMANELQIPEAVERALDLVINGATRKIHLVKINEELCIHLSDIGFNALLIKQFEVGKRRGKLGYLLAAFKAIRANRRMSVVFSTDHDIIKGSAAMIVIANATKYGTGAVINPNGRLDDRLFEVIVINRISYLEIYKMMISHTPFNPEKTQVYQTGNLHIDAKRKVYFQVDGEYLGKVNTIEARIMPEALTMIVPVQPFNCMD